MSDPSKKRKITVQIRDSDRESYVFEFHVEEKRIKYHTEFFDIWRDLALKFEEAIERILRDPN